MQRVTIDSNIYISAFNFGGLPKHILNLAATGLIEIAISEPIIAEVLRVLRNKFTWPQERLLEAENLMRELGQVVAPEERFDVVASDPDDNKIVECAVAGKCEAIVTGDKDLLRLRSYYGITMSKLPQNLRIEYTALSLSIPEHVRFRYQLE